MHNMSYVSRTMLCDARTHRSQHINVSLMRFVGKNMCAYHSITRYHKPQVSVIWTNGVARNLLVQGTIVNGTYGTL